MAPTCSSPPSARPRSTAAPRSAPPAPSRQPATPLGRPPPSSPACWTSSRGDGSSGEDDGFAAALKGAEDVAIVWGERVATGAGAESAVASLLRIADELGLADKTGSGLLEVPLAANGRGIRESGAYENIGPGLQPLGRSGRDADAIREALESGELEALILWDVDPVRDFADPEGWARAIGAANFTLSVSMFGSASAQNADVHLPAETHAEKEGTVTHPDGRLQRVRPSVPHPGAVRPLWQALTDLSAKLGDETGAGTAQEVFELLAADSPLYAGLTYDRIGGTGIRWQEANADALSGGLGGGVGAAGADTQVAGADRAALDENLSRRRTEAPDVPTPPAGALRLGTYHDLWADYVSERNPSLEFLRPDQTLELSEAAAVALDVGNGSEVIVSGDNGTSLRAHVAIRPRMPEDTAFLIEGTREQGANLLSGATSITVEVAPAHEPEAEQAKPPVLGTVARQKVEW